MRKNKGRVTLVLLTMILSLSVMLITAGVIFTWGVALYDRQLAALLSNKFNSQVQLDLTDVSWQGINPVLTFKTLKIDQKDTDVSTKLSGLSIKIGTLHSLFSWNIAPVSIRIDKLDVKTHFVDVHDKRKKETSNQINTLDDWRTIQLSTQQNLSALLDYLEGIQPEIKVNQFKLNMFGYGDRQIALMGKLAVFHNKLGSYRLEGILDTALKKSHIKFDFEIARQGLDAYLRGYFSTKTKDLQKALNFLGLGMLDIYGNKLSISGYVNFQPSAKSQLTMRVSANQSKVLNNEQKTQISFERLVFDLGASYDQNGAFKILLMPHELTVNSRKAQLEQLLIAYNPEDKFAWEMDVHHGQLQLLSDIRNIIPTKMVLEPMRPYIESGNLSGVINHLKLKRGKLFDLNSPFSIRGDFSDIDYLNHQLKLNLSNVSGKVAITNTGGNLDIIAKSLIFKKSLFGMKNFPKMQAKLTASWQVDDHKLLLKIGALKLLGNWFNVDAGGSLSWPFNQKLPTIDIKASATAKEITQRKVQGFLPKDFMAGKLYNWLYENIYGANHVNANLILNGNLSDFPFVNSQGTFKLFAKADGGRIIPWVGWPLINNINGSLEFDQEKFKVSAQSGQSVGVNILPSTLTIGDIRPGIVSDMSIEFNTQADAADVKSYLMQSPLDDNAANWTQWIHYQGDTTSKVLITVPLGNDLPMQVLGVLNLVDGKMTLNMLPWDIQTYHTSGSIHFNKNYATDFILNGWLGLNAPFHVQYSQKEADHFNINAKMTLSESMDIPKQIADKLNGQAPMELSASWQPSGGYLKLNSNFQGMRLNLPKPMQKLDQSSQLVSSFDLKWSNHHDRLDQLVAKALIGDQLDLSSQFGIDNPNMIMNFKVEELNLDDWLSLLSLNNRVSSEHFLWQYFILGKVNNVQANARLSYLWKVGNAAKLGPIAPEYLLTALIEYFKPKVNVQINKLVGFGQTLDQLKLLASPKVKQWSVDLQSKSTEINTYLGVPYQYSEPWQLQFKKLNLKLFKNPNQSTDSDRLLSQFPWWLPSANILIDQLIYNDVELLNQSNLSIVHQNKRIMIPSYLFKGDQIFMLGTTNWNQKGNQVSFKGSATSDNWGDFFESIGYGNVLEQGQGPFVYSLSWQGGLDINPSTLYGEFMFGIDNGNFPHLNPGIAKILGIFSLEAMVDRIGAGINDLNKQGLYFNQIYGKYQIKKGVAQTTRDVIIDTPAFDMQMAGEIDFVNQTLDQSIVIQPHLSGTMALAAGLIGGPVAGLATYVVDKLAVASIFKDRGVARVQVSGYWDDVNVKVN